MRTYLSVKARFNLPEDDEERSFILRPQLNHHLVMVLCNLREDNDLKLRDETISFEERRSIQKKEAKVTTEQAIMAREEPEDSLEVKSSRGFALAAFQTPFKSAIHARNDPKKVKRKLLRHLRVNRSEHTNK